MGWGYIGLFLPIFVGFFMLVFLLTFSHGILQKCFWYYSAGHYTQKIQSMVFSTGGHFGLLLGSFWCMFQYFLRNVRFFLMKFYTDILGIYSLTVNTLFLFFMPCSHGTHSGVCSTISWESFDIFSWNLA